MYYIPGGIGISLRCATDPASLCVFTECAAWRLAQKPVVNPRSANAIKWSSYRAWQKEHPRTALYPEPDDKPKMVEVNNWTWVGRWEDSRRKGEQPWNFVPHWVEGMDDAQKLAIQRTPGFCGLAGRPQFGGLFDSEGNK